MAEKNDYVAEVMLLEKYMGLMFWDQDTKVNFTVHVDNLGFPSGKGGGWNLFVNSSDESVDDEGVCDNGDDCWDDCIARAGKRGDVVLVEYWKNEGVPRDSWDTGKSEVEDNDGITRWVIRLFG